MSDTATMHIAMPAADASTPDSSMLITAIEALGIDTPRVRAALTTHRRAQHHRNQVRRLRRRAPALTLPFLFERELTNKSIEELSRVLEPRLG